MDVRPVGVFHPGVGGRPSSTSASSRCRTRTSCTSAITRGSLTGRDPSEVRRFAREIGTFLQDQGVKLVVNACNTATSAALPQLQEELDVPVVGVITPEAHAAVQATRNRRVGLLATEGTVDAGRYRELVHALDAGVESCRLRVRGSCR